MNSVQGIYFSLFKLIFKVIERFEREKNIVKIAVRKNESVVPSC